MLKRLLLITAVLVPQLAAAADLPYRHYHHRTIRHVRYVRHEVQQNHIVYCHTSDFFLFSYSNCGQGPDPLGVAGN